MAEDKKQIVDEETMETASVAPPTPGEETEPDREDEVKVEGMATRLPPD